MAIFVPWLADAARLTGYPVVEVAGWRTRGHGGMRAVEGVACHHTAGPKTGEYPSLRVVRDGRAGLPGPLSQFGLGRSGAVLVIAAGKSWHAGASGWAGFSDLNSTFLGIEAESSGYGDWTAEQRDAYPRLVAACLYYMRRPAGRAAAHREICRPVGRKPDPVGIDMHALRTRVEWMLAAPLERIPHNGAVVPPVSPPAPAPAPPKPLSLTEDEEMDVRFEYDNAGNFWAAVKVENDSPVAARSWFTLGCAHGRVRWTVTVHGADGAPYRPVPDWDGFDMPTAGHYAYEIPKGARTLVLEGHLLDPAAQPCAAVWHQR